MDPRLWMAWIADPAGNRLCLHSRKDGTAGYSTGTTLVSAFSACILINNQSLPTGLLLAWVLFLAVLGVLLVFWENGPAMLRHVFGLG